MKSYWKSGPFVDSQKTILQKLAINTFRNNFPSKARGKHAKWNFTNERFTLSLPPEGGKGWWVSLWGYAATWWPACPLAQAQGGCTSPSVLGELERSGKNEPCSQSSPSYREANASTDGPTHVRKILSPWHLLCDTSKGLFLPIQFLVPGAPKDVTLKEAQPKKKVCNILLHITHTFFKRQKHLG